MSLSYSFISESARSSLKVPPALTQRLASVEIESGDPKIRKRAAELRKALR